MQPNNRKLTLYKESHMISERIKTFRIKHSLTQEQLASILGVSFTTINAWETGKRIPQHSMQAVLENLFSRDQIHNFEHLELFQDKGMQRSEAGFVSSVISYDGKRDENPYTHGIGRWYGCLPSFFVRDIVKFCGTDLNDPQRALVNFCGSGTVPLEFGIAGVKSNAIDINPIAYLLSYVKTQALKPLSPKTIRKLIDGARIEKADVSIEKHLEGDNLLRIENKWITPNAKGLFFRLISKINKVRNVATQAQMTAALINICIDYCQIDKRCTNHYVFRKNEITEDEFFRQYEAELKRINEKLNALITLNNYATPSISLQDSRETNFESESFDVVFSHPPYGNMVNYYSMSRVQLSILEAISFSDKDFSKGISKALHETQKSDQSASTLDKFYKSIPEWISESHRLLRKDGHIIVVIGDGRHNGYISHPHTEIIRASELLGMKLKELFIWVTENKSGMHVRRKGHHIDHNYVLVLKKVQ